MAGNVTYSASYLAESRAALLNTFYAIPIGLTLTTTTLRIWAKVGHHAQSRLGFDDYLMIFATVCPPENPSSAPTPAAQRRPRAETLIWDHSDRFYCTMYLWLGIWLVKLQSRILHIQRLSTYAGAPYGLGRHVQALSPYDLRMYMMVSWKIHTEERQD